MKIRRKGAEVADIHWNGIEFGKNRLKPKYQKKLPHPYYIYWFDIASNPSNRHFGKSHIWHDGAHKWYCFWYFNIGWSTPWTNLDPKDMPQ